MRIIWLFLLAALLIAALVSCDDREAKVRAAVQQAYRQGATDAIQDVQNKVEQSKQQLRGRLQPNLFIGALVVLALTFFADAIVERIRDKLVVKLELTPERQESLAGIGYALLCGVIAVWSLARCGGAWSLPVLLLLAGATAVFFTGYLPALHQPANEPRRLALSRIKLLLFAVAVILVIYELLASDGLIRLPG